MHLISVVTELARDRALEPQTIANYRRAVIYFSNHIGRDAVVADLTKSSVNGWLSREQDLRPASYVINLRRDLLVVWNFAADNEYCDYPRMRLIRRPKVERPSPKAWPLDWIPKLIHACDYFTRANRRLGVAQSDYARAYLFAQLDLLCRPTDMRHLQWQCIDAAGNVEFAQHKTSVVLRARLSPMTMAALQPLRCCTSGRVFPLSKSSHEKMIRNLFLHAGLAKPRRQSLGHLRHTGGTAIAMRRGNDTARDALGHLPDSRVFERHYLDHAQTQQPRELGWWHKPS